MQKEDTTWFASWFDSPYYHILYKDRDDSEAADFMDRLTQYLNLHPSSKILDLACGKGRHSRYLSSLGYDVTGVDLSAQSITYAKKFEKENLNFAIHDMCLPYKKAAFNTVFNLFTSFGYFDNELDNLRTIKAIKANLSSNGLAVIDFLNVSYVASNLVKQETKIVDGISFDIKREINNGYIQKHISFFVNNNHYEFTEKVRALTFLDFKNYFKDAGLKLKQTFGNYHLNAFDAATSERLILIFGV
jgi:SAM-dependent methyltransferase